MADVGVALPRRLLVAAVNPAAEVAVGDRVVAAVVGATAAAGKRNFKNFFPRASTLLQELGPIFWLVGQK